MQVTIGLTKYDDFRIILVPIEMTCNLSIFNCYLVGGRDDCTELSSAERYNPATNTWSPIVAMMSRRSGVSLI